MEHEPAHLKGGVLLDSQEYKVSLTVGSPAISEELLSSWVLPEHWGKECDGN